MGIKKTTINNHKFLKALHDLARSMDVLRECKLCHIKKSLKEFPNAVYGGDGYIDVFYICIECRKPFHAEATAKYKQKIRKETLEAYGNKCVCCGETEEAFLQIDHINGGGIKHRREIKKDLYKWLKDQGFPKEDYQILCSNCNHAKGIRGVCPHNNFDVFSMIGAC